MEDRFVSQNIEHESLFLRSVHAYIASTKIICRSRRKHAFKLLSRITPQEGQGIADTDLDLKS